MTNGKIRAELSGSGKLTFYNQNGKVLLQEFQRTRSMMEEGHKEFNSALEIYARTFEPYAMMDNYGVNIRFNLSLLFIPDYLNSSNIALRKNISR